jgi:hypothetical protein
VVAVGESRDPNVLGLSTRLLRRKSWDLDFDFDLSLCGDLDNRRKECCGLVPRFVWIGVTDLERPLSPPEWGTAKSMPEVAGWWALKAS